MNRYVWLITWLIFAIVALVISLDMGISYIIGSFLIDVYNKKNVQQS